MNEQEQVTQVSETKKEIHTLARAKKAGKRDRKSVV